REVSGMMAPALHRIATHTRYYLLLRGRDGGVTDEWDELGSEVVVDFLTFGKLSTCYLIQRPSNGRRYPSVMLEGSGIRGGIEQLEFNPAGVTPVPIVVVRTTIRVTTEQFVPDLTQ